MNIKKEIKTIMGKYLKPSMLHWTHQSDKNAPVPECFNTKENYDSCVSEIAKLIKKGE